MTKVVVPNPVSFAISQALFILYSFFFYPPPSNTQILQGISLKEMSAKEFYIKKSSRDSGVKLVLGIGKPK